MIRRSLTVFALLGLVLVSVSAPTAALYNPLSGAQCSGQGKGSAVCSDQTAGDPITGSNGIIANATNVVAFVAGIAAVILIIIGAIRYIISNGDSNNINRAKNTIVNALIGLVVIVLADTLIRFVLSYV